MEFNSGFKGLIFRLHILKDGNLKGIFVCFCLSFLFTCLLVFFSPFPILSSFFFFLSVSDFLSFIIDSVWLCAWPTERKVSYIVPSTALSFRCQMSSRSIVGNELKGKKRKTPSLTLKSPN